VKEWWWQKRSLGMRGAKRIDGGMERGGCGLIRSARRRIGMQRRKSRWRLARHANSKIASWMISARRDLGV